MRERRVAWCPQREPRQYCRLYRQYCTGPAEDITPLGAHHTRSATLPASFDSFDYRRIEVDVP